MLCERHNYNLTLKTISNKKSKQSFFALEVWNRLSASIFCFGKRQARFESGFCSSQEPFTPHMLTRLNRRIWKFSKPKILPEKNLDKLSISTYSICLLLGTLSIDWSDSMKNLHQKERVFFLSKTTLVELLSLRRWHIQKIVAHGKRLRCLSQHIFLNYVEIFFILTK